MEYFGDNLIRLCGQHRLSLVEAAQKLEVSRQALTTWVSGKAKPHSDTLLKIANYFEVHPYRLGNEPFESLIDQDITAERFRSVEARLGRKRPKLTVVHGLGNRI